MTLSYHIPLQKRSVVLPVPIASQPARCRTGGLRCRRFEPGDVLAGSIACLSQQGLRFFETIFRSAQLQATSAAGIIEEVAPQLFSAEDPSLEEECLQALTSVYAALVVPFAQAAKVALLSLACFWLGLVPLCLLACGHDQNARPQQTVLPLSANVKSAASCMLAQRCLHTMPFKCH